MDVFDHKDLGKHLLQLCPKVVKHPVYEGYFFQPSEICIEHQISYITIKVETKLALEQATES